MSNPSDFIIENGVLKEYVGSGEHVVIPADVTEIASSVLPAGGWLRKGGFSQNKTLKSIILPNGLKRIGDFSFERCSSLESITIPNSVTHIGLWAFSGCTSLKSVVLSESLTDIGEGAFRGCSALADSDGFVIINQSLFDYTGIGGDVIIPSKVTNLSLSAFNCCDRLTGITIPESVSRIGDRVFFGCSNLKIAKIPDSVTEIGKMAFFHVIS